MLEENEAALEPSDTFIIDGGDQTSEETESETQITESAPVEDAKAEDDLLVKDDDPDGVKKRIGKITADKYAEQRRADELQKKIDAYEANNKKEVLKKPTLNDPDIDYDEDALESATRKYEIAMGVQEELAKQSEQAKVDQQEAESKKVLTDFNERVSALGKSDFNDVAASIPKLPLGVADAIMQKELGAEMVYHLGTNPEQAHSLANMSPAMALIEIGIISAQLSIKPEAPKVKTSAAPDPIQPLKSGGSLNKERGPSGATYD